MVPPRTYAGAGSVVCTCACATRGCEYGCHCVCGLGVGGEVNVLGEAQKHAHRETGVHAHGLALTFAPACAPKRLRTGTYTHRYAN